MFTDERRRLIHMLQDVFNDENTLRRMIALLREMLSCLCLGWLMVAWVTRATLYLFFWGRAGRLPVTQLRVWVPADVRRQWSALRRGVRCQHVTESSLLVSHQPSDHWRGNLNSCTDSTLCPRILRELRLQHSALFFPLLCALLLPPLLLLPNELCNVLLILCALVNEH